uniref:Uncharacterized protein n=1 Tax=Romanomermis culicivorax TaxID=13658 RepID=A0A915KNX8_ROMCU
MCGPNDTIPVVINGWFFVNKVSQITLTPLAAIFNISLIIALIKLKSIHLHINLRLLLGNVSACSTLASIYSFIKSVTTLIMWIVGGKCRYIKY